MADPDDDLLEMDRDRLIEEAKRLRAGIREHRDSSLHALCWHHPRLWGLLPERIEPEIAVPEWPQFLRGCLRYRENLDRQRPDAPRSDREFDG
ncbi:hypothetical protein [Allosphingosinicella sp.]|uniref:hypothetical protein n=1 Tax=Allosphingosinicella sp. TaxID=2823234 RepID=UPI002FC16DE4